MEHNSTPDRLIPPSAVLDRTSLSRTTIWRMVRAGTFPKAVEVSPGRVAWSEAALNDWIASKLNRPNLEAA